MIDVIPSYLTAFSSAIHTGPCRDSRPLDVKRWFQFDGSETDHELEEKTDELTITNEGLLRSRP